MATHGVIEEHLHNDLTTILQWRHEATLWLTTLGTDQWNDTGLTRDSFQQ